MKLYVDIDTGEVFREDYLKEAFESMDDREDYEEFETWVFLNHPMNGGSLMEVES